MKQRSFVALALILLTSTPLVVGLSQSTSAQAAVGTIAYVRAGTSDPNEIHLIAPDGSADHTILTLPSSPFWVPTLAWRPDSAEIAFSSDHEQEQSLFGADIYAVRPDGSGVRRLTNGPDPSALASYPKGTVTVDVQVGIAGGPFLVYLAGAAAPQTVTGSTTLTFNNVADFGPGQPQAAVAIFGRSRWFNTAVADVQPGQTVSAGVLRISGDGLTYVADHPTWRGDGTSVGFVMGGECGSFEQVPTNPPPGDTGATLLNPDFALGTTCRLDRAPASVPVNQVLYSVADQYNGSQIYLGTEGSTTPGTALINYGRDEYLYDLKWLPDGSGFVYALSGGSPGGPANSYSNLFAYNFGTKQSTQITHFTSEYAFELSVSPDGQTIVFEHGANLTNLVDLWLIGSDGSNMHPLASHAARPSWSRGTAQVPQHVYIPLVQR